MIPAACTCMWPCTLAGMAWCLPLHSLPGAVEAFHDIIPAASCTHRSLPEAVRLAGLQSFWRKHAIQSTQGRHGGIAAVSQAKYKASS